MFLLSCDELTLNYASKVTKLFISKNVKVQINTIVLHLSTSHLLLSSEAKSLAVCTSRDGKYQE